MEAQTDIQRIESDVSDTDGIKAEVLDRISKIIDQIFKDNDVFREVLNKEELMGICSTQMDRNVSPEELFSISEIELRQRLEGIMVGETLGTLLDGLTPEEIETFNAAVEGR